MSLLDKIERRLTPFAVPHPTLCLVIGQTFVALTAVLGLIDSTRLALVPALVLEGEIWRLFTFIFIPPPAGPLFIAFALYLLYLFGTALEHHWGLVRYNLFLFVGYTLTVIAGFIVPDVVATNIFINGSIFLAFAHLNPSFIMMLFFILPVQIRWLAAFTWLLYAVTFFTGGASARLTILAATGNFLLFFGRDMIQNLRTGRRRIIHQAKATAARRETAVTPRHTCVACGKNSTTHPDLDFRYCSKCAGDQCYCPDHIRDHEHVTEDTTHAPS